MTVLGQAQGHFGEWIQGRLGPEGPVALVTVACPELSARVLTVAPDYMNIASQEAVKDVIRKFSEALDLPLPAPFSLSLDMPPGAGAGASTAALVALARAAGFAGAPEALARACLAAEGASDPLMFSRPDAVLWASREARVLAELPPPPACEILGGYFGDNIKTDPQDTDFPDISDLSQQWSGAVAQADLAFCARLASASALRCSAARGPADDPTPELARRLGALGHLRAHTGSARGLIFAPGTLPDGAEAAAQAAGLRAPLRFTTGGPR